ncbi:SMC-Scp complex subunit ScpB [Candidatus Woesearchaeota archaeon]|nr:SMC-Scp complex subunit ScpB [Candidatus Woesearchaeota archaeon]
MMAELKKPSVKSKVEAIIFSTGHRMSLDEISKLSRSIKDDVLNSLKELQKEYDEKQSSLMLVEEGDFWKFTVRDHFIPMVRKIVTETELSRTMLETLAVIAFKYPILQSDLIKLRTNKAYDHLAELEKSGYISRQKHGRTNLIKLTEKFFRYFDLTEEKLKEQFKDFDSIARAIKEKEQEVEDIKEDQRRKAEDLKKEDERIRQEIESLDKSGEEFEVPLDAYEARPKDIVSEEFENEGNLVVEKEKIGDMEVIEDEAQKTAPKKQIKRDTEQVLTPVAEKTSQIFEPEKTQKQAKKPRKSHGIKVTPEMEAKADEKVQEMLGIKQENKEENKESQ